MSEDTEVREANDKAVSEILERIGSNESLGRNIILEIQNRVNITSNGFSEEDILVRLDNEEYEGWTFTDKDRKELVDDITMSGFWNRELKSMSIEQGNEELNYAVREALLKIGILPSSA